MTRLFFGLNSAVICQAVRKFPKGVQQSFMEADLAQLIEKEEWHTIGERISSSSLESAFEDDAEADKFATKIVEKAMAVILDAHDPDRVPSDANLDDITKAAADSLADTLTILSKDTHQPLKIKCQMIISLCLGEPPQGHETLDQAIHAVATDPTSEVYRVFGATACGKALSEKADLMNQELQAAKNAMISLLECEKTFPLLSSDWAQYLAGSLLDGMPEKVEALHAQCKKFYGAARADNVAEGAKQKASASFFHFLEPLMTTALQQVLTFLKIPAACLTLGLDGRALANDCGNVECKVVEPQG